MENFIFCVVCESTVKQSRKNKFVNLFDIDSSTLISVEVKPINIAWKVSKNSVFPGPYLDIFYAV